MAYRRDQGCHLKGGRWKGLWSPQRFTILVFCL